MSNHNHHHEMDEPDATSAIMRDLKSVLKPTFPGPGLFASYYFLGFHMMVTFYLMLLIMAMLAGSGGQSPSLMAFVVLWHVFAVPIWLLRNLTLKLCQRPLGMLLCFTIAAGIIVLIQRPLIIALTNISNWIKVIPSETIKVL